MTPIRQTECGKYGQAWCPAPWCPHERVCPLPNPWDRGIEDAQKEWPAFARETYPSTWLGMVHQAQRAIDAGWAPPPDPHKEIARELHKEVWPESPWEPDRYAYQRRMGDTARRMDLRRGDR